MKIPFISSFLRGIIDSDRCPSEVAGMSEENYLPPRFTLGWWLGHIALVVVAMWAGALIRDYLGRAAKEE
jgi:hypothetical protein